MELQGICHKMHAGLKDLSVTDQHTHKANVEYKFILDRSEVDLPFNLGQEIEIEWTGKFTVFHVVRRLLNHFHKAIALSALKPKPLVTCVL